MASDDGYTYFGDVTFFKDLKQRSKHPQILFESKSKGVTFKFRWSSTHAKTEVESYKCTVCSKSIKVRRGRFVTDDPELVDHPEWCVEKRRAPGSGTSATERAGAESLSKHHARGSESAIAVQSTARPRVSTDSVARLATAGGYEPRSTVSTGDNEPFPEPEASYPEPQKKRKLESSHVTLQSAADRVRSYLSASAALLAKHGLGLRQKPFWEGLSDEQLMRPAGTVSASFDGSSVARDITCEEAANSGMRLGDVAASENCQSEESDDYDEEIPPYIFEVTDVLRQESTVTGGLPALEELRARADTLFNFKTDDLQRRGYSQEQAAEEVLHNINIPEKQVSLGAPKRAARINDQMAHYRLQGWMIELPPHEDEPEANVLAHSNGIFVVTKRPEIDGGKYPLIEFDVMDKHCDTGQSYYCLALFRRQLGELSRAYYLLIEVSGSWTTTCAIVRLFDEYFPFVRNTLITVDLWPLGCSLHQINTVLDKLQKEDALMDFSTEILRAFTSVYAEPTSHGKAPAESEGHAALDVLPSAYGDARSNVGLASSDALSTTTAKRRSSPTRTDISDMSENALVNYMVGELKIQALDDINIYAQLSGEAGPSTSTGRAKANNQQGNFFARPLCEMDDATIEQLIHQLSDVLRSRKAGNTQNP